MEIINNRQSILDQLKPTPIEDTKCCDNPEIEMFLENHSNSDGSGRLGVTDRIFKCKNCGKPKYF
jgi:hypothetical protein